MEGDKEQPMFVLEPDEHIEFVHASKTVFTTLYIFKEQFNPV